MQVNVRYWLDHPRLLIPRLRDWLWEKLNPDKPWMCLGTERFCAARLSKSMRALEYGSGRSTLWFAQRVSHLTSVEHNPEWYERVTRQLAANRISNVDYRFVSLDHPESEGEQQLYDHPPSYVIVADDFEDGSLDFVIVDGHYRTHCIRRAVPKVKPGGYLVVDDVNLWPSIHALPIPTSWKVVDDSTNGLKRCLIWQAR